MAFGRKETRLGLRSAMYEALVKIVSLKISNLPEGCEDPRRMILISRIE
jgi:hypothetical protein